MRRILVVVAILIVALACAAEASAQAKIEFRLGFKALADQIPGVVGQPVTTEQYGPNGDSLQRTTTGLMAWRKADNWTAFTNGARSWVNGPQGVKERANTERFEWEAPAPGDDIETLMAMRDILAVTLVDSHLLPRSPLAGRQVDRLQLTLDYDDVGDVGIRSFTGFLNLSDRTGSGFKRVRLESQRAIGAGQRLAGVMWETELDPAKPAEMALIKVPFDNLKVSFDAETIVLADGRRLSRVAQ